ncbi:MAG: tetratricopeptide repeat protein [Thermoguttaceae bacterium]
MDESELRDLIDQAFGALDAEDYVRAVALGDQLVAAAPDRAVVRAIRAQALLGADAPEESFKEARLAVELDRQDSHSQRLLGMTAWRTSRFALAQEAFEKAIELSGRRPSILSQYAWFMANERGPKPAERAAIEAVEADAESSTAWAALGLVQFRLHRRKEAEESLGRALRLNPNDLYAQSAMVTLLQDQRDDAKAEALAGLIAEHAGAEDLVAAIRDEAKRRRVAVMLVERQVDLQELVHERRSYRWVTLLAIGGVVAGLAYLLSHWLAAAVLALTILVLVVLRRSLD